MLLLPDAPNFTIVEVNDAYLALLHKRESEAVNKCFFQIFPPESEKSQLMRASFQKVVREKLLQKLRWQPSIQTQKGNFSGVDQYIENIPIVADSGEIKYIYHCLADSPPQAFTPSPAEESRGALNKIMESSLDVICVIDEEGKFVNVSTAAERLWGYSPDFLLGRNCMEYVYKPDHESSTRAGMVVKAGRDMNFFENRIICKDGNHMPMIWSAKWDATDKLFYCVAKDATEKKKTELEMKLMIHNTDESFILLDNELKIVAYNQIFYQLYEEYFGKAIKKGVSIFDYGVAGNKAHLWAIYDKVLKGNTEHSEITLPLPSQPPKVFELKYKPAKNDENEVVGVFITVRDVTEATQIKQKIVASEEKYRLLFYNNPLPMWIFEQDTLKILDVNDTAVKKYGYSYQEFCNMTILDIRPKEDVANLLATYKEPRRKDGRMYFGKHTHRKKSKEKMTVEIYGYRIVYDQRECFVVVSNDVTEREKMLQQLKNNEVKLLTAQKIARLGYWQLQVGGREFYWSDEVYNIWGVSKGSFDVNRDSLQTIHPDDSGLFNSQKDELVHGSGSVDFEHRIVTPDGAIKWVHEKGAIIRNDKGEPVIMEGTVQDITAEKLLKLSLAESNQRYHYVTKATSDAIWDWNLVTDEIFWGEGIHAIFGHEISTLSADSSSWKDRIHPGDYERIIAEVNAVINGTSSFWSGEYRFKKADNSFAFVLDRGFVIRDNNGKASRMVGALQDISRQKEEEHRLKLLESVITKTSDGVLILEEPALKSALPKIIYANDAFCQMTSYSEQELVGNTLDFLGNFSGEKDDPRQFLKAFQKKEAFERTSKVETKGQSLLWVHTTYNPVLNKPGTSLHWVAINRNVTQRKNEETKNGLMAEISRIFNQRQRLQQSLHEVLVTLKLYGRFRLAEIWLKGFDGRQIHLSAMLEDEKAMKAFYKETATFKSFSIGVGFPGVIWDKGRIQYWEVAGKKEDVYLRSQALKKTGVNTMIGFPLKYNREVIGALVLGFEQNDSYRDSKQMKDLFESFTPHLSAEIKRKQIEQELDHIFNFSPDIICVANADWRYTRVNPAMTRILGYSEEELLSTPIVNLIHPADRETTKSGNEDIFLEQGTRYIENRMLTKSGKTVWLAWTFTSGNEERMYFCIAKDITEKKNLEHLLNEANRLARIGSWEYNIKDRRRFWSDITKEIHGYDPSSTLDLDKIQDHTKPGKNKEIFEKAVAHALETYSGWDMEIEIITTGGQEKWVRSIGAVEYLNGEPYRLYGSLQDIDARKRAEEAARKSTEVYTIVSKTTNDSIWDWDLITNEVTRPGRKLENLLGYDGPTQEGKGFWENHTNPDDKERLMSRLAAFINDPSQTYWEDEFKVMKPDGTYSTFFDRAYLIRDENGKALRMIGASQDITKLKESEMQLKALNDELQKHVKELAASNAELEQFAYIASHDLQEPLRMVTSFLSQIERKYSDVLDEKGRQYIYFAVDGAKRMRQIILDLLEFSRVGRTDNDLEEININELLNEIMLLFGKQITESNASVTWGKMPVIKSFKSPLRQVFQNLISNALKYQQQDVSPKIKIAFEESRRYWQFSVSDNGIGIDAEYFDRIFVIFQRLHNKDEYSGTGIGLAIVRKIVENMGGKIWIVSEEGKGSVFYFTVSK